MKVVVVGGGPAGANCATRLSRLDKKAEILVLEKSREIAIGTCGLPYYCSGLVQYRESVAGTTPNKLKQNYNVDVRLDAEVVKINREEKNVVLASGETISYDKLVLAVGASPLVPNIKGVDLPHVFTLRRVVDADKIKNFMKNENVKSVAIVGGGFIGIEMAENLRGMGLEISLIEAAGQLLTPIDLDIAAFAHNETRVNGVNLHLKDGVAEIKKGKVILDSGKTVKADMVIMSVGIRPETKIAEEAGIELGYKKAIRVDSFLRTNDRDIFACGDGITVLDFVTHTETMIPLASLANRQGRVVADNIVECSQSYQANQGSAIVKVFNLSIANTGNSEKKLIEKKIPYLKCHIWAISHTGYYPNPQQMLIKLLFNEDKKILGAQAVGGEGVDKRIDVIATVMRLGGTIYDLSEAELCYSPPYSTPKDPVNLIGMLAENVLNGFIKLIDDFDDDTVLVDVRSPNAYKTGTIKGAINIPVSEIQSRLSELPRDKKVVLFCDQGSVSYNASQVAIQDGYDNVYSLSGGLILYTEKLRNRMESAK